MLALIEIMKRLSSFQDYRTRIWATIGFVILLGLAGCGMSAKQIKENAEKEARKFAEPLGWTVVGCAGADTDDNKYVSCTFKDKSGKLSEAECAYDVNNSGCKLKNNF